MFVIQPPMPSLVDVDGQRMRAKADYFMLGNPHTNEFKHLSTSIDVASPDSKKVHVGSGTQIILCPNNFHE